MKSGLLCILELTKMQAIEADQAILRAQPNETVPALKYGVDCWLEKPLLLTPDAMRILRKAFAWIKSKCRICQRENADGEEAE